MLSDRIEPTWPSPGAAVSVSIRLLPPGLSAGRAVVLGVQCRARRSIERLAAPAPLQRDGKRRHPPFRDSLPRPGLGGPRPQAPLPARTSEPLPEAPSCGRGWPGLTSARGDGDNFSNIKFSVAAWPGAAMTAKERCANLPLASPSEAHPYEP